MWLLVAIGAIVDGLIAYATDQAGITLHFGFLVASLVAVWLVCNEIISILENIADIGVSLPPFLMHIVDNLKRQVEAKAAQTLPTEPAQTLQFLIDANENAVSEQANQQAPAEAVEQHNRQSSHE